MIKKRIFSGISIFVLLMMIIDKSVTNVYGIQMEKKEFLEKDSAFEESKENYKYTELKIEAEKGNVTGSIDKEIELYLNDNGIYDNEIVNFDNQIKCELEAITDIEDIEIYTEIVEVNEESAGEEIYKQLDAEEINDVMAEVYYDVDVNGEEKESIINNVLEMVGIKPMSVYAEEGDGTGTSEYIKRSTIVYPKKYNGTDYFRIYNVNNWIKMPVNRLVDTISMRWDGVAAFYSYYDDFTRNNTNANVYVVYNEGIYSRSQGKCISYSCKNKSYNLATNKGLYVLDDSKVELPVNHYCMMPGGMAASVDLMDDGTVQCTNDLYKHTEVETIIISLNAYVKKSNVNKEELLIEIYYGHTQSKVKLDIKYTRISFSSKGDFIASATMFVLANRNCIKYNEYVKAVGQGTRYLSYRFK